MFPLRSVLDEFSIVLSEQKTTVEDFIVWVEKVVNQCMNKVIVTCTNVPIATQV